MPTKKAPAAKRNAPSTTAGRPGSGPLLSTISGPADGQPAFSAGERSPAELLRKIAGSNALSAALPDNPNKSGEIGAQGRVASSACGRGRPDGRAPAAVHRGAGGTA